MPTRRYTDITPRFMADKTAMFRGAMLHHNRGLAPYSEIIIMAKKHETTAIVTDERVTTSPVIEHAEQPDIGDAERVSYAVTASSLKRGDSTAVSNYLANAGYKIAKHVTLPVITITETPSILRFDTPLYEGEVLPKAKIKTPPIMAEVTDMATGNCGKVIAGTVLQKEIDAAYPDNSYVGKVFAIAKLSPNGKRDYSLYSITELLPL